jgi:hypothetical protein
MVDVVYAISLKGKLMYIGRTNNFRRRQCEHIRNIQKQKSAPRYRIAFRGLGKRWQWSDLDFTIIYDGQPQDVKRKEEELIK